MYLEKGIRHMFAIFLLSALTQNAYTQNTQLSNHKNLTQYILKTWTTEDGLPSNALLDVIQDSNGYLWMASYSGLIRFDGINFKTFNRSNIAGLQTNSITRLYESKNKELLIGTESSDFLSYQSSIFTSLVAQTNLKYISAILEDSKGFLWLGTSGGGVYKVKSADKNKGNYQKVFAKNQALDKAIINTIVEDKQGKIWFATEDNGIASYHKGKLRIYQTQEGLLDNKVLSLLVDKNNKLWIGTRAGLCTWQNGKFEVIEALANYSVTSILQDNMENMWLGTKSGLARFVSTQKKWEFLTDKEGLPYNYITKLIIDKEGTLWLTTYRGGLASLRDGIFMNFTRQEGISSKSINSVCEISGNRYLVGGDAGNINLIENNQVQKFEFNTKIKDRIRNIYQDSQENIWISSYEGLLKISPNKQERLYTEKDGLPSNLVRLVLEDQKGNLWIGTKTGGITKLKPDGKLQVLNTENGFPSDFIMSIDEDIKGNIWVGTNDVGIVRIDKNDKFKLINTESGLSSNLIFNITFDKKGIAWITTNNGLNRYQNGKIQTYTSENKLPNDAIFDLLIDKREQVWIPTSIGIIHVPLKALNDFASQKTKEIAWKVYGKQDGMKQAECTGATQSLLSKNGEVWFPTLGGVVKSSPPNITPEGDFPPLYIDYVVADGKTYYPQNAVLELPAGIKRVVFHYKAIYLSAPTKINYRYILKNYDTDWNFAGQERKATYTNLRGGEYIFRLKSSNTHQKWNQEEVTLTINVQYFFYETTWFYILVLLVIFSLVMTTMQFRLYRIRRNNVKLQAKIDLQTQDLQDKNEALNSEKQKVEQSYQNTSTLNEIGQKITSYLDFEELGENIYQSVNELLDATIFGLAIFNEQTNTLDYISHIKKGNKQIAKSISIEDEHSPSVRCFNTGEDLFSNNVSQDFAVFHQYDPDVHAFIYVPLFLSNKKVGVITVQSFRKNAYYPHNIDLLENLAIFVATALNNAQTYQTIAAQKEIIEKKNQDITDSIVYAKRIQDLTLPKVSEIRQGFPEVFVFFKPKDIVSGDYYWYAQVNYHKIIAAIDATGHGVPGAFMSLIGKNLLNEIVYLKEIFEPDLILNELHRGVRNVLQQKDTENNDGMDMAICVIYDPPQKHKDKLGEPTMYFAGARNSLVYIQENEIFEMRGDRRSIGGWWDSKSQEEEYFTQYEIPMVYGGMFYMFSDGYQDQFSSYTGKKLGKARMKSLFLEFHDYPPEEQEAILAKSLKDWQGTEAQIDDVLVLGFRLKPQVNNL